MTQDVYMGRTSQSDLAPPDPQAQTRRPRRTFLDEATKPTTRTFLMSQRGSLCVRPGRPTVVSSSRVTAPSLAACCPATLSIGVLPREELVHTTGCGQGWI